MKITVERTGGLAGLSKFSEMSTADLPSSLKTMLSSLVNGNVLPTISHKTTPMGAADHYTYKITMNDGSNQKVIECDQFNIGDGLKSLVTYVEKHNKNK